VSETARDTDRLRASRSAVNADPPETVSELLAATAPVAGPPNSRYVDWLARASTPPCAVTKTPAGPWLLVLVAVGPVIFGVYSLAEARWRRV